MEWCLTTSMDWKWTLEVLVGFAQILGFPIAAVGLGFVIRGVSTWRLQIQHAVGRSVVISAVKLRSAIRKFRSESFLPEPGGSSEFWKPSLLEYPQDPIRPFVEVSQRVYAGHLANLEKAEGELEVAALEAEGDWPDSAQACIATLLALSGKLQPTLTRYLMYRGLALSEAHPSAEELEEMQRCWAVLVASAAKDDVLSVAVEAAVSEIKKTFKA